MYGRIAAPVDERSQQPAVDEVAQRSLDERSAEARVLIWRHLAARLHELAVPALCHVPGYRHVVGRIGQDQPGEALLALPHQPGDGGGVGGIGAQ